MKTQTEINKALIIKELLDNGKIDSKEATRILNNEFLVIGWVWITERTNKLRKKLGLKNDLK